MILSCPGLAVVAATFGIDRYHPFIEEKALVLMSDYHMFCNTLKRLLCAIQSNHSVLDYNQAIYM